ncbi:uncharacterized protein isoform X2 [Choristoneura fumiferana]|uniref:uncharacterized protein isoform X2 n=1 Tax=Choristoneura fumiferana TaxID=7141 RepID=UPI003D15AFD1
MFYICAICTASPSSLMALNPQLRSILEAIVSHVIDTTPLKDTTLLLCGPCNHLIGTMKKFQDTVLKGVLHLLKLHKLNLEHVGTAHKETPIKIFVKEKPESLVRHEDLEQKIVSMAIKKGPVAQKVVPCIRIKKDSLIKLDQMAPKKAASQWPVEDTWLRSRQLELTEEVDLKSEPESEPEAEAEAARDSESTVTCDEDCGNEEDYRLVRLREQSASSAAIKHSSTDRREGRRGKAAGREGHDMDTLLEERVSWDVRSLTEAEALAELAEARAAAACSASLRCVHCALTFKNQREMKQHAALHNEDAGTYSCHMCTIRCPTAESLREHTAQHLTRYVCRVCRHSSADLECIRQHRCSRQPVRRKRRVIQLPEPSKQDTDCGMCWLTYKDSLKFATHYRSVHYDVSGSACYICHRVFKSTRFLPKHVRQHFMWKQPRELPKRRRRAKKGKKK